jgi:hypothetical protein
MHLKIKPLPPILKVLEKGRGAEGREENLLQKVSSLPPE